MRRVSCNYHQRSTVVGITSEAFEQAGQSIETQNAALAGISEVFTGPQLQRGATALRSVVQTISNTPEKLNAIGVSVLDVKGNFRDLVPILEDVKTKFAGMTEGQRAAALHALAPDKKQQACREPLLKVLPVVKRNYIEQKPALGDVDKAFNA